MAAPVMRGYQDLVPPCHSYVLPVRFTYHITRCDISCPLCRRLMEALLAIQGQYILVQFKLELSVCLVFAAHCRRLVEALLARDTVSGEEVREMVRRYGNQDDVAKRDAAAAPFM